MNETNEELKLARVLVGVMAFALIWQIWASLEISVFAVSAAAPKADATTFNFGVILTDILAPVALAAIFLASQTGRMIMHFAAMLVSLVKRKSQGGETDGDATIDVLAIDENFQSLAEKIEAIETEKKKRDASIDKRLQKVETTIAAWTEE